MGNFIICLATGGGALSRLSFNFGWGLFFAMCLVSTLDGPLVVCIGLFLDGGGVLSEAVVKNLRA